MKVSKGEVFNCVIGENLGHEQCDTRPVVVISSSFINCRTSTILVAPLSTNVVKKTIIKNGREREVLRFSTQVLLRPNEYNFLSAESVVKLDQLKTVSKDRLLAKLGNLDISTIKFLDKKICQYLDIE
ncbi:type II toxin-antitoxin system PemK/MazF family toxin [Enterococcus casseliflavus]|uniref:Type II toxin-antitoxin system PemK/MazF family toxin n=2 Tax=Enterococcus casseliflavus TaxID=37734 RepID=A0A415EQM4_ENTCA|nr:type II toxin-antitoxin system PemK/MazF family toxin [Enterococcus casseliflavus]